VSIDADTYRKIIGTFATGVTVVTTVVDGKFHGLTANAVTSVSLDPLLLLVCVDNGATACAQMRRSSAFGVSILSEDQEAVSNLFAKSGDPEKANLRGVAYRVGATGVPLIEGAIATLECERSEVLDGGDHTIFLGRVVAGVISSDQPPLLYYRGGYRQLAS